MMISTPSSIMNFISRFEINDDGGPPIISGPPFGIMKIRMANVSAETVKRIIDKTLSEIECLVINSYDPVDWSYEIEYGAPPIWKNMSKFEQRRFFEKTYCAIEAAEKATKWFPNNSTPDLSDEDDYDYELERIRSGIFEKRRWSKNQIYIFRHKPTKDGDQDEIIVNFQREGDRSSTWYIFNSLKTALSSKNILWESRKAYTALSEQEDPLISSHITRYLFDENIRKEICTYIS